MKSDWSIPKKSYNNSNFKDNRFLVILEDNFFSHMPQIENTCKLHSKIVKKPHFR